MSAARQSPCINVCKMDDASGWCLGCLRTIDEIVVWTRLSDAQREAVLARLPDRRALQRQRRLSLRGAQDTLDP